MHAALALGINLSVARLGSVINNELSPLVAQASSVSSALWVGVAMCIMSSLAVLVVIPIDRKAEARIQRSNSNTKAAVESIRLSDIRNFRCVTISSPILDALWIICEENVSDSVFLCD